MDICIARQPICDRTRRLRNYQLHFCPGIGQLLEHAANEEISPSSLISQFVIPEMEKLIGRRKAFITFDQDLLEAGVPTNFRSTMVTVEINDDVEMTDAVLRTCRTLKQRRFEIAVPIPHDAGIDNPLVELASIFKVDLATSSPKQIEAYPRIAEEASGRLLATNVKTNEEFENAAVLGYSLFRGDFLGMPGSDVDSKIVSDGFASLRLLYEVNTSEPSISRIAEIVSTSNELSENILRRVNSPAFALTREVSSVRLALPIMGLDDITRWVSSLTASLLSDPDVSLVIQSAAIRANFIEMLGREAGFRDSPSELFVLGLSSILAPFMHPRMENIADTLPLSKEAFAALKGKSGHHANLLTLAESYEGAEWDKVSSLSKELGLDKGKVSHLYAEAIRWANRVF